MWAFKYNIYFLKHVFLNVSFVLILIFVLVRYLFSKVLVEKNIILLNITIIF